MLSRIVVGTDGSVASRSAVQWAYQLAHAWAADLCVAHFFVPTQAETPPDFVERPTESACRELAAWLAATTVPDAGHRVSVTETVAFDDSADGLLSLAAGPADLVVVGADPSSATGPAGSLVDRLAVESPSPVASIPAGAGFATPATFIVGVEGHRGSGAAAAWAASLGSELCWPVVLAHAHRAPGGALASAARRAVGAARERGDDFDVEEAVDEVRRAYPDIVVAHRSAEGDPEAALAAVAASAGPAGIVVVGTRSEGLLDGVTLGPTTKALLHRADVPAIVVQHLPADPHETAGSG
jgi:nucleotide-binding universal stress UspA family protein